MHLLRSTARTSRRCRASRSSAGATARSARTSRDRSTRGRRRALRDERQPGSQRASDPRAAPRSFAAARAPRTRARRSRAPHSRPAPRLPARSRARSAPASLRAYAARRGQAATRAGAGARSRRSPPRKRARPRSRRTATTRAAAVAPAAGANRKSRKVRSSGQPPFAPGEARLERRHVARSGIELEYLDIHAPQHPHGLGGTCACGGRELVADLAPAGIELDDLAGLGILERDEADVGQLARVRSADMKGDDIVRRRDGSDRAIESGQPRSARSAELEIRDHEHECAAAQDRAGELQRGGDVGAAMFGLAAEDLADDPERVGAAFARRHEPLDAIAEQDQADAIVVSDRRHREHAGELCRERAFLNLAAPELARGRDVDEQPQLELALLAELLDERAAGSRRDAPIDRANLVARHVLADAVEVDAAAAERRAVRAGEHRRYEAAGLQLDPPHALHDVAHARCLDGRRRHGIATWSRIRATSCSESIRSASASYVTATRWRSTSAAIAFTSCGVT